MEEDQEKTDLSQTCKKLELTYIIYIFIYIEIMVDDREE